MGVTGTYMKEQHHLPAGQERNCDIFCQFLLVQANCSSHSKKIYHYKFKIILTGKVTGQQHFVGKVKNILKNQQY